MIMLVCQRRHTYATRGALRWWCEECCARCAHAAMLPWLIYADIRFLPICHFLSRHFFLSFRHFFDFLLMPPLYRRHCWYFRHFFRCWFLRFCFRHFYYAMLSLLLHFLSKRYTGWCCRLRLSFSLFRHAFFFYYAAIVDCCFHFRQAMIFRRCFDWCCLLPLFHFDYAIFRWFCCYDYDIIITPLFSLITRDADAAFATRFHFFFFRDIIFIFAWFLSSFRHAYAMRWYDAARSACLLLCHSVIDALSFEPRFSMLLFDVFATPLLMAYFLYFHTLLITLHFLPYFITDARHFLSPLFIVIDTLFRCWCHWLEITTLRFSALSMLRAAYALLFADDTIFFIYFLYVRLCHAATMLIAASFRQRWLFLRYLFLLDINQHCCYWWLFSMMPLSDDWWFSFWFISSISLPLIDAIIYFAFFAFSSPCFFAFFFFLLLRYNTIWFSALISSSYAMRALCCHAETGFSSLYFAITLMLLLPRARCYMLYFICRRHAHAFAMLTCRRALASAMPRYAATRCATCFRCRRRRHALRQLMPCCCYAAATLFSLSALARWAMLMAPYDLMPWCRKITMLAAITTCDISSLFYWYFSPETGIVALFSLLSLLPPCFIIIDIDILLFVIFFFCCCFAADIFAPRYFRWCRCAYAAIDVSLLFFICYWLLLLSSLSISFLRFDFWCRFSPQLMLYFDYFAFTLIFGIRCWWCFSPLLFADAAFAAAAADFFLFDYYYWYYAIICLIILPCHDAFRYCWFSLFSLWCHCRCLPMLSPCFLLLSIFCCWFAAFIAFFHAFMLFAFCAADIIFHTPAFHDNSYFHYYLFSPPPLMLSSSISLPSIAISPFHYFLSFTLMPCHLMIIFNTLTIFSRQRWYLFSLLLLYAAAADAMLIFSFRAYDDRTPIRPESNRPLACRRCRLLMLMMLLMMPARRRYALSLVIMPWLFRARRCRCFTTNINGICH